MGARTTKVSQVLLAFTLMLTFTVVATLDASASTPPGGIGTGTSVGGGGYGNFPPPSGTGMGGNLPPGTGVTPPSGNNGNGGNHLPPLSDCASNPFASQCATVRLYATIYWPKGKQSIPVLSYQFTGCKPTKWGAAIGADYSWEVRVNGGNGKPVPASLEWHCIDAPHFKDTIYKCAIEVGPGSVTGPHGRLDGMKAVTLDSIGKKATAFQTGGRKNVSLCAKSYDVNVNAVPEQFGHYKAVASGRTVNCTQRVFTTRGIGGAIPAPKVIGCTSPVTVNATVKGTLYCSKAGQSGWEAGWTNRDFTSASCNAPASQGGRWQCTIGNPTYGGLAAADVKNPRPVIDDGKNRDLSFGKVVTVTGVRNIKNRETRLKVLKDSKHDSTPWRSGKTDPADATQPFVTAPAPNKWVAGWSPNAKTGAWAVNFQAAGMPGKPWQARQEVRFTGDIKITTVKITRIDLATKQVVTSPVTTWSTMTSTCASTPAVIVANRARLTN